LSAVAIRFVGRPKMLYNVWRLAEVADFVTV